MSEPAGLSAHALSVDYPKRAARGLFGSTVMQRVVHDVGLTVRPQQIVAIVGESGCGKSTLGRAITQLIRPAAGVVQLGDVVLTDLWQTRIGRTRPSSALQQMRQRLQMVFQDSAASLDPAQRVGDAVAEPLVIAQALNSAARRCRVLALLEEVGLHKTCVQSFPHALSGGQLQRINIARALAADPSVIVADEPTSALDVSVKGQVLFMFERLVASRRIGLIFISHDLAAVRAIAQRIYVMYAGRVVESGPAHAVLAAPVHPYTQALVEAAPISMPLLQRARLHRASTAVPAQGAASTGCPYSTQCPRRIDRCSELLPALVEVTHDHAAACIRALPDA